MSVVKLPTFEFKSLHISLHSNLTKSLNYDSFLKSLFSSFSSSDDDWAVATNQAQVFSYQRDLDDGLAFQTFMSSGHINETFDFVQSGLSNLLSFYILPVQDEVKINWPVYLKKYVSHESDGSKARSFSMYSSIPTSACLIEDNRSRLHCFDSVDLSRVEKNSEEQLLFLSWLERKESCEYRIEAFDLSRTSYFNLEKMRDVLTYIENSIRKSWDLSDRLSLAIAADDRWIRRYLLLKLEEIFFG